jgi:hypothetical protein
MSEVRNCLYLLLRRVTSFCPFVANDRAGEEWSHKIIRERQAYEELGPDFNPELLSGLRDLRFSLRICGADIMRNNRIIHGVYRTRDV